MNKLHLGAGYKKFDGFLNVDDDPATSPDILINLEKDIIPLPDNSVDQIIAHHIFEHIGSGFIHMMKELYRVCENNAMIRIVVPHHRHDCFINDPTHARPITVEGMRLFSKSWNRHCIETGDGSSTLGLKYDVDFEIENFNFLFDPLYADLLVDVDAEKEKHIQLMIRERNNVILETHIQLRVVK